MNYTKITKYNDIQWGITGNIICATLGEFVIIKIFNGKYTGTFPLGVNDIEIANLPSGVRQINDREFFTMTAIDNSSVLLWIEWSTIYISHIGNPSNKAFYGKMLINRR